MEDELIEKYFVPEISDLRVGYECEIEIDNEWINKIIEFEYGWLELPDDYNKRLRVPYLTKEAIESEGWRIHNLQKEIKDKNCFLFYKKVNEETFIMVFDPSDSCKRIGIHQEVLKIPVKHFSGTCKDINTLRQIQKLLGI